ncbi:hypothetical protein GF312_16315 [Candidatus Poribacteria bacterium]|nr:hypothetical protein [Candidatus Poribacteria bacterium]
MKYYSPLIFSIVLLYLATGCGEDSQEQEAEIIYGSIQGIVTDTETKEPIQGATINITEQTVVTNADGKYIIEEIELSDNINITASAEGYEDYNNTTQLDQKLLFININLSPVDSPSFQIIQVLNSVSYNIELLDTNKISTIQSYISRDYVAANDVTTMIGIAAGVLPPDYAGFSEAITKMTEKYDLLKFSFSDPSFEFDGDNKALVITKFEVYAETKPKPGDPAKKWEISIDGRIDFIKEDDNWKMIYWQLIPPFHKFVDKPL